MKAIVYATKQTMHQEFLGGRRVPVTTLKVPLHTVLGSRTTELDGHKALIIGIGKSLNKPTKSLLGFLKKKDIDFLPQRIKEIKLNQDEEVTDAKINLESLLTPNSLVTVTAKSKGKGFAGVVKRYGFRGGPRTHGQSDRVRAPGSIGRGNTPGRIVKGKRMAGHMGNVNVTVKNLKIISFDTATNILKIKGLVPGAKDALITIRITKHIEPVAQTA